MHAERDAIVGEQWAAEQGRGQGESGAEGGRYGGSIVVSFNIFMTGLMEIESLSIEIS